MDQRYVIGFEQLGMGDVPRVGGKNASLGEMISHLTRLGVSVPGGFATSADAYREFLGQGDLAQRIARELARLDVEDVVALADTGKRIRQWILELPFPPALEQGIREAYAALVAQSGKEISVAVRSSATAEDLPDASFAGQQETFLNVRGIEQVLQAVKDVFASLFNDRAIAYRVHHGFDHAEVALSAGIQRMARSDLGASGVMFTLDTESGFDRAVFITASYGLGETVVQGAVNPDEFYVYKPALAAGKFPIVRRNLGSKAIMMIYGEETGHGKSVKTVDVHSEARQRFCIGDEDVIALARQAVIIEQHYQRPMDIEWAKDGADGRIYILQARPETVKSRSQSIERYSLKRRGPVLAEGRSIGQKIGAGQAKVIDSISEMNRIQAGDVLVTDMTDPDWEPIMKRAAAIVTNRGGRTCHAAIIARELGIPAVVGCGDATRKIKDGRAVTVSCAEGDTGYIYDGQLEFERREINLQKMPAAPLKIMMNVGNPDLAFEFAQIPNAGVGLARLEFIINNEIGVHPKACLEAATLPAELRQAVERAA
ncbi:MAG TPA: phosphoenolpyruvate synthase, partial [Gammaproteobacteria bacterium]|nr:phosphoenolpyruvate synthase [Gammaproteobacteria bacterium]